MTDDPSIEAFPLAVAPQLRRAYAGLLPLPVIPEAVADAEAWAWTNRRRLSRIANPTGYLYRLGRTRTDAGRERFTVWEGDDDAPSVPPRLPRTLAALPSREVSAVWLVTACGWTNVQAAEALAISPSEVATHVSEAMARLAEVDPDATRLDVETQLRALADHRAAQVPEEVVAASEPEPEPGPAGGSPRRWPILAAAATIVVIVAAGAGWLVIGTDTGITAQGFSGLGLADRDIIERDDWEVPSTATTPSTFVVARVGTDDPVQAAVLDRARERFPPGATFGLLHALLTLESGDVPTSDRDRILAAAVDSSADAMLDRWGPPMDSSTVAELVAATGYGIVEADDATSTDWLDGELRISALEHLAFVDALVRAELPFDRDDQVDLVAALPVRPVGDASLRYTASTTMDGPGVVAWIVGVVERPDATWVFAYNTDLPTTDGDGRPVPTDERLDVVIALLTSAGALP